MLLKDLLPVIGLELFYKREEVYVRVLNPYNGKLIFRKKCGYDKLMQMYGDYTVKNFSTAEGIGELTLTLLLANERKKVSLFNFITANNDYCLNEDIIVFKGYKKSRIYPMLFDEIPYKYLKSKVKLYVDGLIILE